MQVEFQETVAALEFEQGLSRDDANSILASTGGALILALSYSQANVTLPMWKFGQYVMQPRNSCQHPFSSPPTASQRGHSSGGRRPARTRPRARVRKKLT